MRETQGFKNRTAPLLQAEKTTQTKADLPDSKQLIPTEAKRAPEPQRGDRVQLDGRGRAELDYGPGSLSWSGQHVPCLRRVTPVYGTQGALIEDSSLQRKGTDHSTRLFLEQTRASACKHSWLSPNSSQKMQFPFSDGCRVTKLRTAALVLWEGVGIGGDRPGEMPSGPWCGGQVPWGIGGSRGLLGGGSLVFIRFYFLEQL